MEEDFYATIKLKTGEEIFARVSPSQEKDEIFLLVTNPVILVPIVIRSNLCGYKIEPWLKTASDDMFIIKMSDVITISESSDIEIISVYQSYVRDNTKNTGSSKSKISKEMGYIANVLDAKEILEKIFKNN
jgi:hypothetical protein